MNRIRPSDGGATFPLKHRIFRAVWNMTWLVFGSWTPVPLHGWRRILVISFGGKIDKRARIYPGVQIWYPPNLTMEAFSCLGPNVICYCMAPIKLGVRALVSQRASLCAGTHAIDDPNFPLVVKPIEVSEKAWIAAEAFVGPGVKVGEGAVLGARAVAMRSIDAWTVYSGNPAVAIRTRNEI